MTDPLGVTPNNVNNVWRGLAKSCADWSGPFGDGIEYVFSIIWDSYSRDNVSHPTTTQAKPQAVPHQILRPCFIADLPHFPGFFLKYNRVELQYGSFSYPPSKKISLQMRALPVILSYKKVLSAGRPANHKSVHKYYSAGDPRPRR
jgi:hypothetical protein